MEPSSPESWTQTVLRRARKASGWSDLCGARLCAKHQSQHFTACHGAAAGLSDTAALHSRQSGLSYKSPMKNLPSARNISTARPPAFCGSPRRADNGPGALRPSMGFFPTASWSRTVPGRPVNWPVILRPKDCFLAGWIGSIPTRRFAVRLCADCARGQTADDLITRGGRRGWHTAVARRRDLFDAQTTG